MSNATSFALAGHCSAGYSTIGSTQPHFGSLPFSRPIETLHLLSELFTLPTSLQPASISFLTLLVDRSVNSVPTRPTQQSPAAPTAAKRSQEDRPPTSFIAAFSVTSIDSRSASARPVASVRCSRLPGSAYTGYAVSFHRRHCALLPGTNSYLRGWSP